MPSEFQAPRGTFDVLPPQSARYQELVARFAGLAGRAGYGLVVSPMFEDANVFVRGAGELSDVAGKEMYDFEDKGGRRIALRPEGTASVVRAFVQHRPALPFKAWYVAPNFRYDAPQAGRYRQHHQVGVEALGTADPDLDVEVVSLAWDLLASVGLTRLSLLLNSMGDAACRPAYRDALVAHLDGVAGRLCDQHRTRYPANPLRVLDCKTEACRRATEDAPRQIDHLCEACGRHFDRVRAGLGALGVPFTLDTRLVRGFDYYTRTTFEIAAATLESAQNAVGGGGRYDGLAELLGGPPTPGIGFGLGIERILLACDAEGAFPAPASAVDVFVVDVTGAAALTLTARLRREGLRVERSFGARSMKAQVKAADRSGARFAVIVGPDEAAAGQAAVRDLRDRDRRDQELVGQDQLADHLRKLLSP